MPVQSINIKIGGAAGAGIKSTGMIIGKTLNRLGFRVFEYSEYPSLIRGGHNSEQIYASTTAAYSQIEPVDILLALNKATIDLHISELRENATIIFDSKVTQPTQKDAKFHWLDVPMLQIARDRGNDIMQNNVGIGVVIKLLGITLDVPTAIIREEFKGKKQEVIDANITSLQAGHDYIDSGGASGPRPPELRSGAAGGDPTVFLNGSEAIGMGAIASGIGLYAAYPMTPSSPILHFLVEHQQEFGYVVKQPEDEISAANIVIGAMHVGVRAACGTSGGGFALMNETLALSGMTETPMVVILAQRPGPATGLPTWTEQGELQYAIHAAHGEFPKFVLAPGDPIEAFQMMADAFNLAERYQTVVILLTDKYLGESSMSVPSSLFPSPSPLSIDRGAVLTQEELSNTPDYQRYAVTENGISPRSFPGMQNGIFVANSDEHDYHGLASETQEMRLLQMDKRLRKGALASRQLPGPILIGSKEAPITVITWGSSKLPAMSAMDGLASGQQAKINILHFSYLWPLNTDAISKALESIKDKKTLIIEGNATGQFQSLLKEHFDFSPTSYLRRYDGRPIYPEQIIEKCQQL